MMTSTDPAQKPPRATWRAPRLTTTSSTETETTSTDDDDHDDDDWRNLQRLRRQSEKRSRARRAAKIRAMRQQLEALSLVQCVLPLVDAPDAVWDEFLDDDLKRTRHAVRCLLPAAREIQTLLDERTLLTRLQREHDLQTRVIQQRLVETQRLEAPAPADPWKRNVLRWRTLTRVHFRPWTLAQCEEEIEAATNEMNRFLLGSDMASSGLSFMGWHDRRRIDPASSHIQFTLTKAFRGADLDEYIASSWRVYTEADAFTSVVLGGRAKVSFEVLQEISPTVCLVRTVERYDHFLESYVHCVYLIARVQSDDGAVVQFMRSVKVPELQRAMNQPQDMWSVGSHWLRWDRIDTSKPRSATDFRVWLGGTMFLEDLEYIQYWLFELLAAVVRSEAWSTNKHLLKF